MKKQFIKTAVALAAVGMGLMAMPALAVQVSFASNNTTNAVPQKGSDPLGNSWETTNGTAGLNSSFTMANAKQDPQLFNKSNFSNGLGDFANSFQMTVNRSQNSLGFQGLNLGTVASGLSNSFAVQTSNDGQTWMNWDVTYDSPSTKNGLYQTILFTAPVGTRLSQGQNFSLNVNFAGILTNDAGWAASWDDRLAVITPDNSVPEPGSLLLMGIGMMGLIGASRRKKA